MIYLENESAIRIDFDPEYAFLKYMAERQRVYTMKKVYEASPEKNAASVPAKAMETALWANNVIKRLYSPEGDIITLL
jgi:hypothetical protein